MNKYIPENHQALNMEQFNETVFSKHTNSSFRLVRRNTLDMDLLATLIQEIVIQLAKYIGKRSTSFKKLDIILHNEFNAMCFGSTQTASFISDLGSKLESCFRILL